MFVSQSGKNLRTRLVLERLFGVTDDDDVYLPIKSVSQLTAGSSAWWRTAMPPLRRKSGQSSTMWCIVWSSPQSQSRHRHRRCCNNSSTMSTAQRGQTLDMLTSRPLCHTVSYVAVGSRKTPVKFFHRHSESIMSIKHWVYSAIYTSV